MCENRAVVFAARQTGKPPSHPSIAEGKLVVADLGELTDQGDAVAGKPPLHRSTHAP